VTIVHSRRPAYSRRTGTHRLRIGTDEVPDHSASSADERLHEIACQPHARRGSSERGLTLRAMSTPAPQLDHDSAAIVDRITRTLLEQLQLQTQAALVLLEQAPAEERDALLARIAETRGRLVRLRATVLGRAAPALVRSPRADGAD
jgi:hypothetical protein